MTKKQLKELMDTYCLIPLELDDVINFVADLLYLRRKDVEKKEPYAVRTMNDIETAENLVYDLIDYISELEDEECTQLN